VARCRILASRGILDIDVALFRPLPRPDSLEDLFLERYGDLLRAAFAITGGRREAEDLVHDAFVRLLLAKPDLASIEHPDAYLRTVLRNLHTARLRRRSHRAETPLSIADFDSAQFAARALSPSQWTQARYDVAAACRYACTRRLTSKTGSLFLLRFVHEIVPSDLARVVRLTRDTVDITLARGRAEVKAYLEHPARALEPLGGELVPMSMPDVDPGADDEHDYLARVREAVFGLRHARCFEPERLRRLYAPTHDGAISTQVLSEIVTCPACLDQVGRLTQVPPRVEQPRDADPPSTDAPSPRRLSPRDPSRTRRAAAVHSCRAIRAHRPRMLRVVVNGFEVGTHEISGAAARVTQTVSSLEPVWLVEVYSEQDVCLASLDVTPLPEAPAEQRVRVDLADDRRIELALSFLRPWPTVSLAYDDPAYVAPLAAIGTEISQGIVEIPEIAETLEDADAAPSTAFDDRHAIASPPSSTLPPSPERLFQWRAWTRWMPRTPWPRQRSPRLAWGAVAFALTVWLVFFTPGTSVSAAERIWRALAALLAPESTPAPRPPAGPARQREITLPAPPAPTPRGRTGSPAPVTLTPGLLAELEIDALTALHARHALAGQRIQVTRTPVAVAVEGLVEGQNRDEIVRALREVPHGAALRVTLSTPADLIGARGTGNVTGGAAGTSTLRAVTLDRNAVPAADDLRRALASRGGDAGNIEAEIHRLANDGLRHARAAFLEAATLRTLAERFDAASASGLADITSTKWRALLTAQAERVAGAVDRVRTELEPLFIQGGESATPAPGGGSGSTPSAASTRIAADQHLGDAARRIAEDLGQVERATRAALAVAETAPATIELRDATFWRRLGATRDRIAAFTGHVNPNVTPR
jgi:RNA polymerase sigma factor (sigma-70 family)